MKIRTHIATLILAGATPIVFAAPANAEPAFAGGRILVEPRAGLTADEFARDLKIHGAGKAHKLGQSNIHLIDVPHGSEKAIANKLKNNPHFKFAELDQRVEVAATTNDPYLGSEWHINKIGANTAWDKTQGSGIIIAILDSGQDATHPDLIGNTVPGYNIYDNNSNTADVCGHGTKVAGAAAAIGNNAAGVTGVAGKAKIMPVRIAYNNSGSCYALFSTMASGVTWAADHGARVVNISYGNAPSSAAVQSAANYLRSKGGLLFVSTGNNAKDEGFVPTSTMIPVSSTDSADNLSSFSSYGAYTALSAPGSGIYTTVQGGTYGSVNGTSFASPIAAAVAALVMSANPSLSADQVQNILFSTAVDLGTPGRDSKFGYGRVNAAAAVQAAGASTTAPADAAAPLVSIASPLAGSTVSGTVTVNVNASDNVGVSRVDLKVNGTVVATDSSGPFSFAWDSKGVANGMNSLVAVAYDAAGNVASSNAVSVNVTNAAATPVQDSIPPVLTIANPVSGAVSGNVDVVVNASDNSGAAGIKLSIYIDDSLAGSGSGSSLVYRWSTRKLARGTHTVQGVARDAAGNTSSKTVQVTR
ncbi:S8 family serine peptidase [Pseudoduganella violaceinigra]|uniref:S8 family serine peptidase n=1 Tax=Pseudoduganella violaceinigra TaxID=246602 RepID=UPI0004229040|nr:S8 family serine peptidase [Pseudoduganella violaceinigra]